MSDIDYDLLAGQSSGDPPDGPRSAYLMRAQLVDTRQGTSLVTEWQSEAYFWTAWFGFNPQRIAFTQDFLDAVGVDRARIMEGETREERDAAFEDELEKTTGRDYRVRIEHKGSYINTYVAAAIPGTPGQTSLDDVPIDSEGLPEPPPTPEPATVAPSTSRPDDEDLSIPF